MKTAVAMLCVLVIVLAACTKVTSSTSSTPTPTTNSPTPVASLAALSPSDALKAIYAKRDTMQWTITYALEFTMKSSTTQSTLTQYLKGSQVRNDMTVMGIEVRTYQLNNTFTSCMNRNSAWRCSHLSASQDKVLQTIQAVQENPSQFDVASDGTKTILGHETNCYHITDAAKSFDAIVCYTSDGAPLAFSTSNVNESATMTATSYDPHANDEDFTLPTVKLPAASPSP